MAKLVILPLDSRPCTYDFPYQLISCWQGTIVRPPRKMMDHHTTPSQTSIIRKWLFDQTQDADTLVVSIEQLLHGGLIASRKVKKTKNQCMQELEILRQIKTSNPNLEIYGFSIIMRSTVSTLNVESQKWWKLVSEYSHQAYLQAIRPTDATDTLEQLTKHIPESVLSEYLQARERNHAINLACTDLVADHTLENLILLQEDCSMESLQVFEQQTLDKHIKKLQIDSHVAIHNGTDEAASELCVKVCTPRTARLTCHIEWLGENKQFIARYEDRAFTCNLTSHMKTVGLQEDAQAKDVLFIYLPKGMQRDHCSEKLFCEKIYSDAELFGFSERIIAANKKGKRCHLLDLAYANGGDLDFMRMLNKNLPLSTLSGYSAWNTASNALGTALAQIGTTQTTLSKQKHFVQERILDDLIYQSTIRPYIQGQLKELGEDIWNIHNIERANSLLQKAFLHYQPLIEELFQNVVPPFSVQFRWPRTFEVEIFLKEEKND